MIDKSYGKYQLQCDSCGSEPEDTFDDFQGALDYCSSEGWGRSVVGGIWQNYCKDCGKAMEKEGLE